MEQPVITPPKQMQEYWKREVIARHADDVKAYLDKNNLQELPLPEYVTPDQAIFYREIDGVWESLKYPAQIHGLVTAVQKNWLMARPVLETLEADSTEASSKSNLNVATDMLVEQLKKRDTRETNKSKSLKCTVKGCRKRFATESNMKIHITRKHKEN
tara:strand:+ start:2297 stop:2770 length:474 start_codon:yes stop_codon:yes gene_type:complete